MNRSPLKFTSAVACAAVLMLPLAACGKDDEDKAPGAGSTLDPVVQKYVDAVTPICAEAQKDIDAISSAYKATPTPAQFKAGLVQGSDRILAEIEALKAVTPPPALAERVAAWLAAFGKDAAGLKELTVADAKRGIDAFSASGPLADDLGLGVCKR